jgi:hypothetical protein
MSDPKQISNFIAIQSAVRRPFVWGFGGVCGDDLVSFGGRCHTFEGSGSKSEHLASFEGFVADYVCPNLVDRASWYSMLRNSASGPEIGLRAGFWPDCYRENTEIGRPAGRRTDFGRRHSGRELEDREDQREEAAGPRSYRCSD